MLSFYNLDHKQKDNMVYEMGEIFKNSLDNFKQNQIKDGEIRVDLDLHKGGKLTCAISDNGTGVPRDQEDRLFEGVRSLKGYSGILYGRSGYGLSRVHEWVESEGGDITYKRLPRGSQFIISIDTHRHSYPVNEIGTFTTVAAAREGIVRYYLGQLHKVYAVVRAKQSLTTEEREIKRYMKYWLGRKFEELTDYRSLYHSFVYAVRQYIEKIGY